MDNGPFPEIGSGVVKETGCWGIGQGFHFGHVESDIHKILVWRLSSE